MCKRLCKMQLDKIDFSSAGDSLKHPDKKLLIMVPDGDPSLLFCLFSIPFSFY